LLGLALAAINLWVALHIDIIIHIRVGVVHHVFFVIVGELHVIGTIFLVRKIIECGLAFRLRFEGALVICGMC
jgi:hypothetical protein